MGQKIVERMLDRIVVASIATLDNEGSEVYIELHLDHGRHSAWQ